VSVNGSKEDLDTALDEVHVAAADKDLNEAYAARLKGLDKAGKETLREEQRAWIKERDAALEKMQAECPELLVNNRVAEDALLLKLTKERIEALRAK
jgi:uncharacterized protein YecT (DUF1311 family)